MSRLWVRSLFAVVVVVSAGTAPASASSLHGAATGRCEAGRAERSLPVVQAACTDIRPGGPVWTDRVLADQPCTLNFLFKGYRIDEEGQRVEEGTFIATAGHCVLEGQGVEEVWAQGEGPRAWDAQQREIGRFAYAWVDGDRDFALVRLHEGVEASPRMCEFGGPTGINTELSAEMEFLRLAGQGIGVREVAPGREVLARHMSDPDVVWATGPGINGDSGSPVIDEQGRAVGVMTGVGLRTNPPDANLQIGRLGPQLARAEQRLGLELELQTAALTA